MRCEFVQEKIKIKIIFVARVTFNFNVVKMEFNNRRNLYIFLKAKYPNLFYLKKK